MAKLLTFTALAASLFAISACSDVDYAETGRSAVAGAAIGAGANYLVGNDLVDGALVGAAGGAGLELSGLRDGVK